jgi:hypothetical protein
LLGASIDFGSALPDGLKILERAEAVRFNHTCRDVSSIRYCDVVGSGRPLSWLLSPSAAMLTLCGEPDNDGLVSVRSASRACSPFAIWHDDHAGLVGHDLDHPLSAPNSIHLNRYEQLVSSLAN